jgi:hypothetical protein
MRAHRSLAPEVLETRIAPAVFFLHGDNLTITDGSGASVTGAPNEITAAAAAGSNVALLMKAGDSLFYDFNGDNAADDPGDILLANISGGRAMLFFTDRAAGPAVGSFQPVELTGAAVSDGFNGNFEVEINGPVVTALSTSDDFTFVNLDADPQMEQFIVQKASINGLRVNGVVNGAILAGGSMSNITVLGTNPGPFGSVNSFRTGNASILGANLILNSGAAAPVSVGGVLAPEIIAPGANGGDITNVFLADGALILQTGDGMDGSAALNGGRGGNISKIRGAADQSFLITPGDGGAVSIAGANRNGGAGGSISDVSVAVSGSFSVVTLEAGDGGAVTGTATGNGGAGGSLSSVTLNLTGLFEEVRIAAGSGGIGRGAGKTGGAGGAISKLAVSLNGAVGRDTVIASDEGGNFLVLAGNGGTGVLGAAGAKGGGVIGATLRLGTAGQKVGDVTVFGGGGGFSTEAAGAAGGGIKGLSLTVLGILGLDNDGTGAGTGHVGSIAVLGGDGGGGTTSAGDGGAVESSSDRKSGV